MNKHKHLWFIYGDMKVCKCGKTMYPILKTEVIKDVEMDTTAGKFKGSISFGVPDWNNLK